MIVKRKGEFCLVSRKVNPKTGERRNLGCYPTKEGAEKRERQVEFFKRVKGEGLDDLYGLLNEKMKDQDPENCVFCQIIRDDPQNQIIYEDDHTVAFNSINPVAPVHILVVPRQHVYSLLDLKVRPNLLGWLLDAAREIAWAEGLASTGFRTIINTGPYARQTISHLHLHLLGGRDLGYVGFGTGRSGL